MYVLKSEKHRSTTHSVLSERDLTIAYKDGMKVISIHRLVILSVYSH